MTKVRCVGVIAEDNSDFETIKVLVQRITGRSNLCFKRAIGDGCGKIRRKALAYCKNFSNSGCDVVIILHDLDRNNLAELENDLNQIKRDSPIQNTYVCIPVEEIEAWLIGDPSAIRETFKLSRPPKFNGLPESIPSPKEHLRNEIYSCSGNTIRFLTQHNSKIAAQVCIATVVKKCPSFAKLHNFLMSLNFT